MQPAELAEQFGLDAEETLAWARERIDSILGDIPEDSDLRKLLEGLEAPAYRPRPKDDEPSVVKKLPPIPSKARAEEEEDVEEIEELDLEEFEEIDDEELELIEEEDEDEGEYADVPVRTGDTAPHAVVTEEIADDSGEVEGEWDDTGDDPEPSGEVDDELLGDDSIPIDLDEEF